MANNEIIVRLDEESLQAIKELTEALKDIKELKEKPPLFWPIEKEKNPLSPPYIFTCGGDN